MLQNNTPDKIWENKLKEVFTSFKFSGDAINLMEDNSRSETFQYHEFFLQAIWNDRQYDGELKTVDGLPVVVLSPGTWNVEAGPDFLNAALLINHRKIIGDVEVHRYTSDWFHHGHDKDKNYRNVVLHVVFSHDATENTSGLPLCVQLAGQLRDDLADFIQQARETYGYHRKVPPGRCSWQISSMEIEKAKRMLAATGWGRFLRRSRNINKMLCQLPPEQVLWQELLEALGYKKNREAFRELSRNIYPSFLRSFDQPSQALACLFGSAGLLPDPIFSDNSEAAAEIRQLWDLWWSTGLKQLDLQWNFSGSRPANRPERRLFGAWRLFETNNGEIFSGLMKLYQNQKSDEKFDYVLEQWLTPNSLSSFDSNKITLGWSKKLHPGIGKDRARDIVVNVLLPFLHALGEYLDDKFLIESAKTTFFQTRKTQDNRILKEMKNRLLFPPSIANEVIENAAQQQGLLEISRTFCRTLGGECLKCPFSEILRVD